jgi:IclR family pca regulon transcriptional regulator
MQAIDALHREFVGSLAKGLSVLSSFGRQAPEMTLSRVAEAADMTRAAARRHLLTLQALGYVSSDGRKFSLTPKVLELGFSFLSSRGWISVATPVLDELRRRLGESVSATILEGPDVVYVCRFPADRVLTVSAEIGTRRPAYCTAMGRVLLADLPDEEIVARLGARELKQFTPRTVTDPELLLEELDKVREEGHSVVEEELEPGLIAISVPLRNSQGRAVAAVNVCSHSTYGSAAHLATTCLQPLKDAVAQISRAIV